MAERSAPDPLPVTEPTELDDAALAAALAEGSPYADRVFGALDHLSSEYVAVSFLCLGKDYHLGEIFQGYYFVGAKRSRAYLMLRFAAMSRFRSDAAQLAFSKELGNVPERPHEERRAIAGYWFREST